MHTLCVRPTRRPASLSTGRFSLRRFAIRVLLAVPALLMAIVLSWAPAVIAADSVTTPDADGVIALGNHNSLQLDAAGNPVVSYTVGPPTNTLRILHCDDPDCAPGGESKQDPDTSGNAVGALNSLALDTNGYPVVSYRDDTSRDPAYSPLQRCQLRCDHQRSLRASPRPTRVATTSVSTPRSSSTVLAIQS